MTPFSIEIHFPNSRSKNYPDVIKRARLFFNFSENPNVLRITDVNELFGRWEDFTIVIWGATKWAGTNVFFCGSPVLPYKNDFFYTLQEIKYCFSQYNSCTDKITHCPDSHWGCKRIKDTSRLIDWRYGAGRYWYKTGKFIDDKTWKVDKKQILLNIFDEARKKMLSVCPFYDQKKIESTVDELPNTITVDNHWTIEYQSEVGRNGVTRVPKSINHVALSDSHVDQLIKENPYSPIEPEAKQPKQKNESIDDFLDQMLEQRKKKDPGRWEETPF